MSSAYASDHPTVYRDHTISSSNGKAHFSALDITAFLVASVMLLVPLAMAAYGAWTTPIVL